MARTYIFKFTQASHSTYFIEAVSRKEAIEKFNKALGIPFWFIKKYFKIKKVWKVSEEDIKECTK